MKKHWKMIKNRLKKQKKSINHKIHFFNKNKSNVRIVYFIKMTF